MPAARIIPIGTRFGKLVIQEPAGSRKGQRFWRCLCDCGRTTELRATHWGKTASCGKCDRELRFVKHGMSSSPEHGAWSHIKGRCLNPTDSAYFRYGARGITMFEGWIDDFQSFYDHVGPRPTPQHTIERVDNNKGYEPGNVVWDSRTQQARNRRSNRLLTFNGKTLCVAEWAEEVHIDQTVLYARLYLNWSVERALTTPVRPMLR